MKKLFLATAILLVALGVAWAANIGTVTIWVLSGDLGVA